MALHDPAPDVQVGDISELRRYWSDPAYRAACDAEVEANRPLCHAAIDRGMAVLNEKQRARWAAEEATERADTIRRAWASQVRVTMQALTDAPYRPHALEGVA